MADLDEGMARKFLEYALLVVKALKFQNEQIYENALATSALLQAVFERFPDLAHKYGQLVDSQKKTQASVTAGQWRDELDAMSQWAEVMLQKIPKHKS